MILIFAEKIESREQVEESLKRWRYALETGLMKVCTSQTEYWSMEGDGWKGQHEGAKVVSLNTGIKHPKQQAVRWSGWK